MYKKVQYRVLFILIAMLSATSVVAQEEFIDPPSRDLVNIPFEQLTGGIIILHAKFADFPDTLNFILDTGSSGISLDSTTIKYFGLVPTPSERS